MTLSLLLVTLASLAPETAPHNYARWEKDIAEIEKRLADDKPKPGGIAFIGSSSIVKWDVKKSFPKRNVVNLGFGGSVVVDSTHFAPRILYPLEPKTIVFYAGDNDIARKNSPEQVAEDFAAFMAQTRKALPDVRIIYVPIKPSVARWDQYETQSKANGMIRRQFQDDEKFTYLDIVPAMLGKDGKPRPELFVKDGLHMSEVGYAIWNKALEKVLDE